MTLAIGGSSSPANPTHGALWVDVRDYGAKADNGVTDNSIPIQAAIDDVGSRLPVQGGSKGVVFIPSAPLPYIVNKSIWVDSSNVEVRGEGWGSTVLMTGGYKHSVFIFGVQRVWQTFVNGSYVPLQINATNRPDLFGKLDASAAPAPGSVWGIRTNGNSFAQFQAGPMSAGVSSASGWVYSDNWSETSKLTVEFCVEPPDGQSFPPNSPLLGLGHPDYEPAPFVIKVWDQPNKIMVMFRTSDIDQGTNNPNRVFSFALGAASPPYRVAVQFDLTNAVCSAFVNGVQVAFIDQYNMAPTSAPPFTPGSGLKFITNDHAPFMIGATGVSGPFGGATGVDLRLYGLRLSNTLRYQNNGPGRPQVRADSPTAPINDAFAYFGNDAKTVCFLKATDNPATSGRVVTVQNGGASVAGTTSGIFLHSAFPTVMSGNAIRDVAVAAANPYGQAISVGVITDLTIENVKATGGYHGVGSFIMAANYFVHIRNCWFDGFDAGYFGAYQQMHARDVTIPSTGRVAIRHLGCGARWENVFIAYATAVTECLFKARSSDIGGTYSISNMLVDFEGPTIARAAIFCEAHGTTPSTTLELKDVVLGTIGPTASLVMVRDAYGEGPDVHKCWLSVENLQAFDSSYLSAIDVDGPLWHGEVKSLSLTGARFHHRRKWATNTNVVVRETKYVAPPRLFPWYNGAHVLEVRSPADGQYTEWRCVGTGAYGTPNPPAWAGINPLSVSRCGVAGYVLNHAYVAAALS